MIRTLLVAFIILLLVLLSAALAADLWKNRRRIGEEPGSPWLIGAAAPVIMFLATMGVPDFVMDTLFFEKCRLVDDKRLPGSLVVSASVPLGVVSVVYLITAKLDIKIVLICMICQAIGATIGVKLVSRLDGARVKKTVGAAMLLSALFILIRIIGVGGGNLTTLPAYKLVIMGFCAFFLGIGNMMGMGAKAPYMSILLMLGLSADCVLPIIMTACMMSSFFGGVQYIRRGLYQRKVALLYSTVGFIGIAAGFIFVTNLPQLALQLIMLAITIYVGISMLVNKKRQKKGVTS